jgi:hypothetical protein
MEKKQMALIHVLEVPEEARNPERPVSSLLKSQVEHLREAEQRLPQRYRTDIYVNAIKTEAEAARYIRKVTEAIQAAHKDAARLRRAPARKPRFEIAAAAAKAKPKRSSKATISQKKSTRRAKSRRKKG